MTEEMQQAAAEAPAIETTVTETPQETSPSIEQTMSKAYDTSVAKQEQRDEQRRTFLRSERGQFTRKVNAVAQQPGKPAVNQLTPDVAPTVRQAPTSVPAELRDKLNAAAPELVDWISKREAESHQKITELGQLAKSSEQFRQVAERYTGSLRGQHPAEAFEKLLVANEMLERNPAESIKWLAQSYGIDLGQSGGGGEQFHQIAERYRDTFHGRNAVQAFEQLAAANEYLSRDPLGAIQWLAGAYGVDMHQLAQSSVDPAAEQAMLAVIDHFAQDKPDWAAMERDIFEQAHALRATNPQMPANVLLERAYERAARINPAASQRRSAEADKQSRASASKRAADAKRASLVNVRSTVGVSPKPSGNWENTMREVADRLLG